jgi:hypothetical protein
VLPEPAPGREIDVSTVVVPALRRPREQDGGMFHCQGLVLVDRPRVDQVLTALLKQAFLVGRAEVVHLDGQLATEVVEEYLGDPLPGLGGCAHQGRMAILPHIGRGAQLVERLILDFQ